MVAAHDYTKQVGVGDSMFDCDNHNQLSVDAYRDLCDIFCIELVTNGTVGLRQAWDCWRAHTWDRQTWPDACWLSRV